MPTFELSETQAKSLGYASSGVFDLVAGERLILGQLDPQEVYMDEEVPEGKAWAVNFYFNVIETDA